MASTFSKLSTAGLVASALVGCGPETSTLAAPTVLTVTSTETFDATENRLRNSLTARKLKLFTVVDHGEGAKSVGEDIGRSKLFIFGNPKAGTPLMIAEPKLGLELPMKILIHEAQGEVHLHRSDVATTVRQYGVIDQDKRLGKINETLDSIMTEAAQPKPAL